MLNLSVIGAKAQKFEKKILRHKMLPHLAPEKKRKNGMGKMGSPPPIGGEMHSNPKCALKNVFSDVCSYVLLSY